MRGGKGQFWRAHMAARRIRQLGDRILRVRCTPVEDPKSPAVRLLSDDLRDTLRTARKKYDMGRALAAPQIGAPVRVVLVEVGKFRATMINPEITDVGSEDFHVWDDCFSFPNRSEEHTSELQSQSNLVCRLLLEKKKKNKDK